MKFTTPYIPWENKIALPAATGKGLRISSYKVKFRTRYLKDS